MIDFFVSTFLEIVQDLGVGYFFDLKFLAFKALVSTSQKRLLSLPLRFCSYFESLIIRKSLKAFTFIRDNQKQPKSALQHKNIGFIKGEENAQKMQLLRAQFSSAHGSNFNSVTSENLENLIKTESFFELKIIFLFLSQILQSLRLKFLFSILEVHGIWGSRVEWWFW